MILKYLQDSSNHKYPILISSASVKRGDSEIFYCIRKHEAEDFFCVTFVCICRDEINTWFEEGFVSGRDANEAIMDAVNNLEASEYFRKIFVELLATDSNILHVTAGLTVLYLDKEKTMCVSKRDGRIFKMPGFVPSQNIINLFKQAGGELYV